jgi:hypothetical protein
MSKTQIHAAAFALAVATTGGTFAAANALAKQQYAVAERVVLASVPVSPPQTVLVVGHRDAET